MNAQPPSDHDNQDLGPPVTELRELLDAPRAGVLARVRGNIHRRLFAGDAVDFVFQAFFATMFEYVDLLMKALTGMAPTSAKEKD